MKNIQFHLSILLLISCCVLLINFIYDKSENSRKQRIYQYHQDKKDGKVVKELPFKAVSTSVNKAGTVVVTLEDGSVWKANHFNSWKRIDR